jgi:hypothetical protein
MLAPSFRASDRQQPKSTRVEGADTVMQSSAIRLSVGHVAAKDGMTISEGQAGLASVGCRV